LRPSTRIRSTSASTAASGGTNTFGRYSRGKFLRDGPTAFGAGGGHELVSLGGVSDVKNQSLAYGLDHAFSSSLLADFRFGFFRYNVNVLPFDYGTTPAADAGIPGLNLDKTFTSGLPYGDVQGDRGFRFGSSLDANRCNCPLEQDEHQLQFVETSRSCSAATRSRQAWTFDARTTCGCRATPTDPGNSLLERPDARR
jgi:hypothetical protein